MNGRTLLIILAILAVAVNGRVYYLPGMDENRYSDLAYPVPNEQSSRDLDLSFSAGDSDETENKLRPVKKVSRFVAFKCSWNKSTPQEIHNSMQ